MSLLSRLLDHLREQDVEHDLASMVTAPSTEAVPPWEINRPRMAFNTECMCGGKIALDTYYRRGKVSGVKCSECPRTYTINYDFTNIWVKGADI